MQYSKDQTKSLWKEYRQVIRDLQFLQMKCISVAHAEQNPRVQEFLRHGSGRRISVLWRSLKNIFDIFLPDIEKPLGIEAVGNAQINLHAFVINLSGTLDNLAWIYVIKHDLEATIGGRQSIGLFSPKTMRHLPEPIQNYLNSPTMTSWAKQYLKEYRDALAHRIPLYIPPAAYTSDETAHYQRLEEAKNECMTNHEWEKIDAIDEEQSMIGRPCVVFLHSNSDDEELRPVYLHPQILCDAMTIVEFGGLFFENLVGNA